MPIESTEENYRGTGHDNGLDTDPDHNHQDHIQSDRKPTSADTMRVRCPQCRKLYMVQFQDVSETKPRFECVQCHARFWLSMADMDFSVEVTGIPVQVKEAPLAKISARATNLAKPFAAAEMKPCPKCFKPVAERARECPHCGVLVQKVKNLQFIETEPAHSHALTAAWQKILNDYGDEALHDEFVRLAQSEDNLAFAGLRYGQMIHLMASDEITKKRVREVQALALAGVQTSTTGLMNFRPYARVWQVPLLAAAMMMVIGLFLPVFRNMVGVGAAILFVAIAIQIQTRRRS